ncbi:nucleoside deaminase [Bifidobacterium jacchi]|uniref:tRNA-specific adenosine deaminase n=1 Tax=Bifidobacterium jacchi TaxID=2490545 RepID=A0A5N5RMS1_9BIFI|nr:nucleoside deaminase [Bifidobacterium jacchi]KAB5608587.1 nucleoside deaminase [Bifidobacterium jacchi]
MSDDEAMRRALALAAEAAADGEVPVGAVVLDASGMVVGEGCNARGRVVGARVPAAAAAVVREAEADPVADPLAHAEVVAMRAAAHRLGGWNLADCTLIVTLEPCPMCAGACVQTHIGRIVFGAWDAKLGACGSVWDIPRDPHIGHVPEVVGGVREADCARLLAEFFAARR